MRTGLIMEGGAMRGLFTNGVLDVFMENGVTFDGAIGVSAGAAFGCNFKSHQIGRPIRYNKKYCKDKRFSSVWSFLTTGDLYGAEFCYETLPWELDLWDQKTFKEDPMEFYCVCTDVHTGMPVYQKTMEGDREDIKWIRASASVPMVSRPVKVGGYELLDGGIADSIPLKYFESIGYDRNVVIETQPADYRKKPFSPAAALKVGLRGLPAMQAAILRRHVMYNRQKDEIARKERKGEVFVIRPKAPLNIGGIIRDPEELERVYQLGRQAGEEALEGVKAFLAEKA